LNIESTLVRSRSGMSSKKTSRVASSKAPHAMPAATWTSSSQAKCCVISQSAGSGTIPRLAIQSKRRLPARCARLPSAGIAAIRATKAVPVSTAYSP